MGTHSGTLRGGGLLWRWGWTWTLAKPRVVCLVLDCRYNDLSQTMYPNSQTSHNAELHAVIALLTGVVGIGDWRNMTNGVEAPSPECLDVRLLIIVTLSGDFVRSVGV